MARRPHRTYRGKLIDIDAIVMMNKDAVAVGNANMNARGDILGKGGTVVKTKEAIAKDYYQRQVQNVVQSDETPAVAKVVTESADELVTKPAKKKTTKVKK